MAKKLRVYGGCFNYKGRQVRGVMAGTQKQCAAAIGAGIWYIREYWAETGNAVELAVAARAPGVLFWRENDYKAQEYRRVDGGENV